MLLMLSFQNPMDALEISVFSINMSFSFPIHYQDFFFVRRSSVVFTWHAHVFALMVSTLCLVGPFILKLKIVSVVSCSRVQR